MHGAAKHLPQEIRGKTLSAESSVIDAFAFARHGEQRSGVVPLVRLTRVVDGLPEQADGDAGLASWSVRGLLDSGGRPSLRLHVSARPILECQRCMQPFAHPIESEVVLQLVNSPADLDDERVEDDEIDPDAPEKVVGSPRFNLLEQVEDELVLCIPYVPKHDICPGAHSIVVEQPEPAPEENQARPSPFSVLAQLKKK